MAVFTRDYAPQLPPYNLILDSVSGIPVERINITDRATDLESVYSAERVKLSFDNYLRKVRPDLVHFQHLLGLGLGPLEVALDRKIPTVVSLHDFFFICHRLILIDYRSQLCEGPLFADHCRGCIHADFHGRPAFAARAGTEKYGYVQKLLERAGAIVAPSHFVKEVFRRNLPQLDNIIVSPNGLERFALAKYKRRVSRILRIGYAGPIWRHKGVHVLVDAFNRLSSDNVTLSIHGRGDPAYIQELKRKAPRQVHFFVEYRQDDLPRIFSKLDVAVFPSLCYESFSYALWEAMSAHVPVLVSNIGGQAEAVSEGHEGYHFRVGDVEDLTKKLDWIAVHAEELEQIRKNLAKRHFRTIGEQAQDLARLYSRLIRRSQSAKAAFALPTVQVNSSRLLRYVSDLEQRRHDASTHMEKLEGSIETKNEELMKTTEHARYLRSELNAKDQEFKRTNRYVARLLSHLKAKNEGLQKSTKYAKELLAQLAAIDEELERSTQYARELTEQFTAKDEELQKSTKYGNQLLTQLEAKDQELRKSTRYLTDLMTQLKAKDEEVQRSANYAKELLAQLVAKDEELHRGTQHAETLATQLREKNEEIQRGRIFAEGLQAQIERKDAQILSGSEYARKLAEELAELKKAKKD